MLEQIRKHVKNQEGATAIEYGLMVALIAVAIIAAVTFLSSSTCETFDDAGDAIAGNAPNTTNNC